VFYPRIEFSPAIKKEKRTCSNENFLRNKKNNLEYILCVSVAKRGDLETPTKSALLFFVRGEKRKTFLYFFLLGEKRVFTTPLTRNTLSTNITTNITNVEFPLAVVVGLPRDTRTFLKGVCVLRILVEKQNKTTLFKVTEPSSVPYRTPSACGKRAVYKDPPPVIPVPVQSENNRRHPKFHTRRNPHEIPIPHEIHLYQR